VAALTRWVLAHKLTVVIAWLVLASAGVAASGPASDALNPEFLAHTLRRVDPLQPALLVISLISTIGFALSEGGAARISAMLAAAGFLIVLLGSAAWLVPIQRRVVASGPGRPSAELERLRAHWLRGHMIRTVVALASLSFAVVAAVS
jgi:hypothetical protein